MNCRLSMALARGLPWLALAAMTGQPVVARDDSPLTPGLMRRNETWLALR